MNGMRGALAGLLLAVVAVALVHGPLESRGQAVLALFLALTACVYLGALLAQNQTMAVAGAELAMGVLVFVCSLQGVGSSPLWLAVGYALHGAWDWAHHVGIVSTRVARWFPPACAVFDLMIAAFVVVTFGDWG